MAPSHHFTSLQSKRGFRECLATHTHTESLRPAPINHLACPHHISPAERLPPGLAAGSGRRASQNGTCLGMLRAPSCYPHQGRSSMDAPFVVPTAQQGWLAGWLAGWPASIEQGPRCAVDNEAIRLRVQADGATHYDTLDGYGSSLHPLHPVDSVSSQGGQITPRESSQRTLTPSSLVTACLASWLSHVDTQVLMMNSSLASSQPKQLASLCVHCER